MQRKTTKVCIDKDLKSNLTDTFLIIKHSIFVYFRSRGVFRQNFTDMIKALRIRSPSKKSEPLKITDPKLIKKVKFQLDKFEDCEQPTPPISPDMSFDLDNGERSSFDVKEEILSLSADGYFNLDSLCDSEGILPDMKSLYNIDISPIRKPSMIFHNNSADQYELDKRLFSIFIPSILSPKSADNYDNLNQKESSKTAPNRFSSTFPPVSFKSSSLCSPRLSSTFPPSGNFKSSLLLCSPPLSTTFPPSSSLKCRRSTLLRNAHSIKNMASNN